MDRIIRCITEDGSLMASAIDSTLIAAAAQQVHGLTKTPCAALGRLLTAASMMGAMLKANNASVTLKIKGDGPLGTAVAIADSRGNVRGYVEHPDAELPLKPNGKLNVGGIVGKDGRLAVIRDLGTGDPYVGQVELVSGEIAEDITNYYVISEQIPTACALGVLTDKENGKVLLSGGLLLQVLPGADEAAIDRLEKNVEQMEPVTTMLAKGMTPETMCQTALKGFEVQKLDEFEVHYACNCSKQRYAGALLTLGAEELKTLPFDPQGKVEAVCQYCGKRYYFSKEEIDELISRSAEPGKR